MKLSITLAFGLVAVALIGEAYATDKVSVDVPGNIETLAKLRTLAAMKKDEFEKTADFDKRLCAATYKALGINADKGSITVGLETSRYASSAMYNADKQAFRVHLGMGGNHFKAGKGYNDMYRWNAAFDPYKHVGLRIADEYAEGTSGYSGSNAFGISKDVKVASQTSGVLYFPAVSIASSDPVNVMLAVKADEARRIQSDIRVAVVTHLQPPCFVAGRGREPPTIEHPTDIILSEVGLIGTRNPEWVIYLDSTKEILKRGKFR
jgi:hypothetical protein